MHVLRRRPEFQLMIATVLDTGLPYGKNEHDVHWIDAECQLRKSIHVRKPGKVARQAVGYQRETRVLANAHARLDFQTVVGKQLRHRLRSEEIVVLRDELPPFGL